MTAKTTEQEVIDGHHAERILSDPVFKDAVLATEQAILDGWYHSASTKEREDCFHRKRALDHVIQMLRATMDNGRLVADQRKERMP